MLSSCGGSTPGARADAAKAPVSTGAVAPLTEEDGSLPSRSEQDAPSPFSGAWIALYAATQESAAVWFWDDRFLAEATLGPDEKCCLSGTWHSRRPGRRASEGDRGPSEEWHSRRPGRRASEGDRGPSEEWHSRRPGRRASEGDRGPSEEWHSDRSVRLVFTAEETTCGPHRLFLTYPALRKVTTDSFVLVQPETEQHLTETDGELVGPAWVFSRRDGQRPRSRCGGADPQ